MDSMSLSGKARLSTRSLFSASYSIALSAASVAKLCDRLQEEFYLTVSAPPDMFEDQGAEQ